MYSIPRLRHVADFTATRLTCAVNVARRLPTSNHAVRHLLQTRQASTLSSTSVLRPSIRRQGVCPTPVNSTRCISVEAPREPTAGSEPGIDITDEGAWPQWRQKVQSQITAVDFSADRLEKYELTNATLGDFLAKPREDWVTCRWINGEEILLGTGLK